MTKPKRDHIKTLTCSTCGQECKGRQWWNQDTGFGLCPSCFHWLKRKYMTLDDIRQAYGKENYHYFTKE